MTALPLPMAGPAIEPLPPEAVTAMADAAKPAGAARYVVEHETQYAYTAPVSQSWQLARLTPRQLPWQNRLWHCVQIEPRPDERDPVDDSFGNHVIHFGLHGAHRMLRVRMRCVVDVMPRPLQPVPPTSAGAAQDLPWEQVRDLLRFGPGGGARPSAAGITTAPAAAAADAFGDIDGAAGGDADSALLSAAGMSEPTPLVPLSEAARVYAEPSLAAGRGWLAGVTDLMHRIHADFDFEPGATTVSTSVDEVLQQRSGVCQDFAHLMLACLRGHGLAARYVSGYLLTDPPPGMPRLMGADASHAWVAAWSPGHGWVEFDPTNDTLADRRYITLAWGADFGDVVPLRGVILGGGGSQGMDVWVSVIPQE